MRIADLCPGPQKVTVEGTITFISPPKSYIRFGKRGRVCRATLKDESGEVVLVLWNEEIPLVRQGQRLSVVDGQAREYEGRLELSKGRFGKLLPASQGQKS